MRGHQQWLDLKDLAVEVGIQIEVEGWNLPINLEYGHAAILLETMDVEADRVGWQYAVDVLICALLLVVQLLGWVVLEAHLQQLQFVTIILHSLAGDGGHPQITQIDHPTLTACIIVRRKWQNQDGTEHIQVECEFDITIQQQINLALGLILEGFNFIPSCRLETFIEALSGEEVPEPLHKCRIVYTFNWLNLQTQRGSQLRLSVLLQLNMLLEAHREKLILLALISQTLLQEWSVDHLLALILSHHFQFQIVQLEHHLDAAISNLLEYALHLTEDQLDSFLLDSHLHMILGKLLPHSQREKWFECCLPWARTRIAYPRCLLVARCPTSILSDHQTWSQFDSLCLRSRAQSSLQPNRFASSSCPWLRPTNVNLFSISFGWGAWHGSPWSSFWRQTWPTIWDSIWWLESCLYLITNWS